MGWPLKNTIRPMFTLDHNNARTLQISNDAFYYLSYGEEPLDESNLEEAEEVVSMFPNGFCIDENWHEVEDYPGMVEATFIPYIEDQADYDMYEDLTPYIQQQIKWLEDGKTIRVWWYNKKTGERNLRGDFKVYTDKFGNKCFHTGDQEKTFESGKCSLYYIKHLKKRQD